MWEVSGNKGGFQSVQPILVVPGNGNGERIKGIEA
jgi:hypothetical protein